MNIYVIDVFGFSKYKSINYIIALDLRYCKAAVSMVKVIELMLRSTASC